MMTRSHKLQDSVFRAIKLVGYTSVVHVCRSRARHAPTTITLKGVGLAYAGESKLVASHWQVM